MEKDSALYQLMDTRMHSVMNGIVSSDGEYQAILRKSDITPANWTGWIYQKKSGCKAMFFGKCLPTEAKEMTTEL